MVYFRNHHESRNGNEGHEVGQQNTGAPGEAAERALGQDWPAERSARRPQAKHGTREGGERPDVLQRLLHGGNNHRLPDHTSLVVQMSQRQLGETTKRVETWNWICLSSFLSYQRWLQAAGRNNHRRGNQNVKEFCLMSFYSSYQRCLQESRRNNLEKGNQKLNGILFIILFIISKMAISSSEKQ